MSFTASELIVETLEKAGVRRVYGLPGDSLNGLTLRGKEFLEYENPCDVGMRGLLGFASGYHAMEECDALLMLGTDFPYRDFYPEHATVIQVDVRGEQIGRRIASTSRWWGR